MINKTHNISDRVEIVDGMYKGWRGYIYDIILECNIGVCIHPPTKLNLSLISYVMHNLFPTDIFLPKEYVKVIK